MIARCLLFTTALLWSSACEESSEPAAPSTPPKTSEVAPTPVKTTTKPVEVDAPKPTLETKEDRIETITFPSEDGLGITADLYQRHPAAAPFIVLFHQAGWSRGEYKEIAPTLSELGFNCMAVDQRSGGSINGVDNETKAAASEKKLGTNYLDALPDMRAALRYVESNYPDAKRIAWGSSYSSALVLVIAGQEKGLVDATLSFSPGEYFVRFGEAKDYVSKAAARFEGPAFITSAKKEGDKWESIFAALKSPKKARFLPTTAGNHGSRALWSKHKDSDVYWEAVTAFLKSL